jgi:circadian clock protein KaiC
MSKCDRQLRAGGFAASAVRKLASVGPYFLLASRPAVAAKERVCAAPQGGSTLDRLVVDEAAGERPPSEPGPISMTQPLSNPERAGTGVAGLDDILGGGFPRRRLYLIAGDPGAGKTTLALQFLLEGARNGEPGLYVALSETEEELRDVASSHGWSLDGITICDLAASEESLKAESQYTLFHPAEVELSETTRAVLDIVERVQPRRVAFDSLSEMRLLARDPLRYRRQILALKAYFTARPSTVLLLDYESAGMGDRQVESLAHGVLKLEQLAPEYGGQRRRLRVQKIRGIRFRDGYHDFSIVTGGLVVYPRLVAAEHQEPFRRETVSSGIAELDALLGGGLDRGTSTLFMGPAGVGKSTVAAQYAIAALNRGEKAAFYVFDEVPDTLAVRGEGLGMGIREHLRSGRLRVQQVNTAELSPGEFAQQVRRAVEHDGIGFVILDSLNGYQNAMPEEHFLSAHMHELLAYLNQRGVVTLLVMAQHGVLGQDISSPIDISYLADTVVLLRYFEHAGQVRKAISVVKKRTGNHEKSIRELDMGSAGIHVGEPLHEFQGVLTGNIRYLGGASVLAERGDVATGV